MIMRARLINRLAETTDECVCLTGEHAPETRSAWVGRAVEPFAVTRGETVVVDRATQLDVVDSLLVAGYAVAYDLSYRTASV